MNIIVAVDSVGGFSKNGKIPWIDGNGKNMYPEDFKFFKETTKNGIVVMGRNTYLEILNLNKKQDKSKITELLPNRESIVLSRDKTFTAVGAITYNSLRQFKDKHEINKKPIFIIGGEKLFIEVLPMVKTIYMSIIKKQFNCDKKFLLSELTKKFKIVSGKETDDLYFVKYDRTLN